MKRNHVPLSKPIPVKLSPETLVKLDRLSKRLGEPRSTVMRMALRIGLDGLERGIAERSINLASLVSGPEPGNYPPHQEEIMRTEDRPASSGTDTERKVLSALKRDIQRGSHPKGQK